MEQITLCNPLYPNLRSFVENLPHTFNTSGESIYEGRNTLKRYTLAEGNIIVKRYKTPILLNRIAYTWLRPTKADRAYLYAEQLLKKGIRTPQPIGTVKCYQHGLFSQGYFLYIEEPFTRLFREFDAGGIAGREKILDDFCTFTLHLHQNGILHIDYSPGNILFEEKSGEPTQFSLLDLNRMHFGHLSRKECLHNFARLTKDLEIFTYLITRYCALRNWELVPCLQEAKRAHTKFWKKWHQKLKVKKQIRRYKNRR